MSEPNIYSKSDLTYNSYLKVPELLQLQVPQSEPAHHDEMLFIIIHQAYELWFKLILHELNSGMAAMRAGDPLKAHHFVKRVVEIMRVLVQQIHILETMAPVDFLGFRDRLMPASGFQSLQFRELEFLCGLKDERYYTFFKNRPEMLQALKKRFAEPDLRDAFEALLRKLGHTLPEPTPGHRLDESEEGKSALFKVLADVYAHPSKHLPFYLLCESLVDFDQYLALWREHHVRVVERVIGFKRGTGGSSGVDYLKSTLDKKAFPMLWEVRTHLTKTNEGFGG
jgi:tryptophan 2,3-dioxygenase